MKFGIAGRASVIGDDNALTPVNGSSVGHRLGDLLTVPRTERASAWPARSREHQAYTCDFVPVPPGEMKDLADSGVLTVLHRDGPRTTIYCHGDHISGDLARALSQIATRYSRVTVCHNEPVSPRQALIFRRVRPADLPARLPTVALFTDQTVWYMDADQITDQLVGQLQAICAEETRYLAALPVIAPVADLPPGGRSRRGSSKSH